MAASDRNPTRTTIPLPLLGALAAALLARGARVTESLWYDEVFAWIDYVSAGPGTILTTFANPVNHVLNSLLTWMSINALGDVVGIELGMRLPALLASIALVPVMYGIGRDLWPQKPSVAAIAAWLAATLSITILEGVEARGYSMMILSAACSTWCFIRLSDADRSATRRRDAACYVGAAALGVYAHPMTAFVSFGHAAGAVIAGIRHRRWAPLGPIIGSGILSVLLYLPLIDDLMQTRSMYERTDGNQPGLLGIEGLHAAIGLSGSWNHVAAIPGALLVVLGIIGLRRFSRDSGPARFVIGGSLGLALLLVMVLIADAWIYARFTLFALPAMIVLMTVGAQWLIERARLLGSALVAIVVITNVAMTVSLPPKQPLRDVMTMINPRDGERVLVVGLAHPVISVYANGANIEHSYLHGRDFEAKLASFRPDWVVVMYPSHVDESVISAMPTRMDGHRRLDGWGDWGDGSIDVYGPADRF